MTLENTTSAFQAEENFYARRGLTPLPTPHITGMKLLGDVALGDLTLNTIDDRGIVWVCTEIENWWSLAEPAYPRIDKSFGDGSYDVSGRYQQRDITLAGSILVPDPKYTPIARKALVESLDLVYKGAWLRTTESQETVDNIVKASVTSNVVTITTASIHTISVGDTVTVSEIDISIVLGAITLTVSLGGTYTVLDTTTNTVSFLKNVIDVSERTVTGTISSSPMTKASWVRLTSLPEITTTTARGRIDFAVGLTAPDPVKYYWSSSGSSGYEVISTPPSNPDTGTTGEYSIINRGNTSVGVIISVTGPTTGPLTIVNTTTDKTLTVRESINGSATLAVTKKSYFNRAATLTTSGPHNLYEGKEVTVSGVDTHFNGTYVVTDIPSPSKFTYKMNYNKNATFSSYRVGKTVSISSREVVDYTATVQTSSEHGFIEGMSVLVEGFTSGGAPLNGIQQILSVPTDTSFTFTATIETLSSGSASSASATGNIVTATSDTTLPYVVGDLITIGNMNPAANVSNSEVIFVSSNQFSLKYYSDRSRSVRYVSFDKVTTEGGKDSVTLTTWDPHGVRVGDTIYVEGCGRPATQNNTLRTATAKDVDEYTITYEIDTFTRDISEIAIAKSSKGRYKVTVKTSSDHNFRTGDKIQLRGVLRGGTEPRGINTGPEEYFTIERLGPKTVSYELLPPSSTKSGLISYFGVESGAVPLSSVRNNYIALASFEDMPINSETSGGEGGQVLCFALIDTTSKTSTSTSNYIEEVASSGSVAVSSDTLVVNTSDRSAILSGSTSYARSRLDVVTDWIKLAPGVNNLKLVDEGDATSTATVSIKYRSGWLA